MQTLEHHTVNAARHSYTTPRLLHGTRRQYDGFDKTQPDAKASGESMSAEAYFFTTSTGHASGYAGQSEGARVWFGRFTAKRVWEFDAKGVAYSEATALAVEAATKGYDASQVRQMLLDHFRFRVLSIVSGEAIANIPVWIGMRRRYREWSPGAKPGRCLVARPGAKQRSGGIKRETIEQLKENFRAMAESFVENADLIVVRNVGDSPVFPGEFAEGSEHPHDVYVVIGSPENVNARIVR